MSGGGGDSSNVVLLADWRRRAGRQTMARMTNETYLADPADTPFLSGLPRTKARAILREWQIDILSDPAA